MSSAPGAPWSRAIIHVDMDAFYASVELKDDLELTGKPVAVGALPQARGVVAAASYEARKFGVCSAMPMAQAVRLCPELVIRSPRFERYEEESQAIRRILLRYTPLVQPISLDEAFLDVTGSQRLHGPAPTIGRSIQQRIGEELGLSASVGVAGCRFLAKLASDLEKPTGFVVVEPGTEEGFLKPLPVARMWGVGPVTAGALSKLGVHTIGDLQQVSAQTLGTVLGNQGCHLVELAHGRDDSPVQVGGEAKSISAENTFARDLTDPQAMERELLALAERVGERLRDEGLACRTLTLKVRFADFHTITRSTSLREATRNTEALYALARDLLCQRAALRGRAVRLLGLAASHLTRNAPRQLGLFGEAEQTKADRLDRALDDLRKRLGSGAVRRGRLIDQLDQPTNVSSHQEDKG